MIANEEKQNNSTQISETKDFKIKSQYCLMFSPFKTQIIQIYLYFLLIISFPLLCSVWLWFIPMS